jgi:hypothetical protein
VRLDGNRLGLFLILYKRTTSWFNVLLFLLSGRDRKGDGVGAGKLLPVLLCPCDELVVCLSKILTLLLDKLQVFFMATKEDGAEVFIWYF